MISVPLIRIQEEDFDPGAELEGMIRGHTNIGAIVNFLGLVRDMHKAVPVHAMTLEYYPKMTESVIEKIVDQAKRRWQINNAVIIHRVGRLKPADRIVFVAVASTHRGEAFEACEYIIDYLKTDAPFWKKEETQAGSHWVEARKSDTDKVDSWYDTKTEEMK